MNSAPARFIVPRVVLPGTTDSMPLMDELMTMVGGSVQTIRLLGSGKTTALQYLKDELGSDARFVIADNLSRQEFADRDRNKIFLFASRRDFIVDLELKLAPWADDECIEYLMCHHAGQCKSVMQRLNQADDHWLAGGSPFVWPAVLDAMAASESIATVEQAIVPVFDSCIDNDNLKSQVADILIKDRIGKPLGLKKLNPPLPKKMLHMLTVRGVQMAVSIGRFIERIDDGQHTTFMHGAWPDKFIQMVATRVQGCKPIQQVLEAVASRPDDQAASLAASILIRNESSWQPTPPAGSGKNQKMIFDNAKLQHAQWMNVDLSKASLINSTFANAKFQAANLGGAMATGANFAKADLAGAELTHLNACRACFANANLVGAIGRFAFFTHSDLSEANFADSHLENACFRSSDLRHANFEHAQLEAALFESANVAGCSFRFASLCQAKMSGTDLRFANLDHAKLDQAGLYESDLEGNQIRSASLVQADLRTALLTDLRLRDCVLTKANLSGAKMAQIDWEYCDLRHVDFSRCHFHMGSSRSGLVDSPYPSHGSRTGFYTDEFDQQYFKSPEEIRKANLCHCDLRGANVQNADFYLVDLRGARFSEVQRHHFQKTGAILD